MSEYDVPGTLTISSPSNPRVKWLVGLRKRRNRDAAGVCLVEGYAELRLAMDAGVSPLTLYHCPDLVGDGVQRRLLQDIGVGTEIIALAPAAFAKASVRESPDGWLAVVPSPVQTLESLQLSDRPLVLVCESVEKPGNLGALLRTAEAVGLDAVIAASPVTDWGNPNVVRASKGALFAVPVADGSADDVAAWLTGHRLHVVAADPAANALVTDIDLTLPTAIVVGAEHEGLSHVWRGPRSTLARLPMRGRINSLNVSAAAAVVAYEAIRQRGMAS
jgi:RNA methyltransferase, TrmH family